MTAKPSHHEATDSNAASASSKSSWLPIIAVAFTMLAAWGVFALMQRGVEPAPQRMPTRFVLPQEFSGPVKVYYGFQSAEPLTEEDGYRIVAVPPSGVVLTSSEPLYGQALDQFVRLDAEGNPETLGYHFIRDRKGGLTGDGQEYFLRPEELELRDGELIRWGIINPADGTPKYGVPYELFTIRDDF